MKRKIKELMRGFSDIAVVNQDSTLFETLLEIGVIRERTGDGHKCPAALVVDGKENVAGFLDFRNILKGLEPKYGEIVDTAQKGGFPPNRIRSELEKLGLWEDPFEEICNKAGGTQVKSLMTIPEEDQITDADASVDEVIHQMIVTGRSYLFVRNGNALTGVVSLSDIMTYVSDTVKGCRI